MNHFDQSFIFILWCFIWGQIKFFIYIQIKFWKWKNIDSSNEFLGRRCDLEPRYRYLKYQNFRPAQLSFKIIFSKISFKGLCSVLRCIPHNFNAKISVYSGVIDQKFLRTTEILGVMILDLVIYAFMSNQSLPTHWRKKSVWKNLCERVQTNFSMLRSQ